MIKNEKGFALTEVLILSAVVIGVLTFMFIQFKSINRSYQRSFKYDTPEGLYLANNILNYINENNYDMLVDKLLNTSDGYIDITNCDINLYNTSSFCEDLYDKSGIEQIIFTKENPSKIKMNLKNLNNDMQDFIKQIKTINSESDYRIIIKYTNGTFATMRFNKGNSYVQDGLIAYLDGINNTGEGHSNDTTVWKDLTNNGNDATLYNNPTWNNASLTLDGVDDYGILANMANTQFSEGLTLETRAKILSIKNISTDFIIDNENSTTSYDGLKLYITKTSLRITTDLGINGSNSTTNSTDSIIELNKTHTITTTYDNNTIKLYIDGNLVAEKNKVGEYLGSTQGINIGRQYRTGQCSNIEFQNILIYDRALSDSEIQRNYQADIARY